MLTSIQPTQVHCFFNLPSEIRDMLYDYIIETVRVDDFNTTLPLVCPHIQEPLPFTGHTSLLCVNSRFKNELLKRYYQNHTVRVVLNMSDIGIAHSTVVSMKIPTRGDWNLIRKLDITIIRDHEAERTSCAYCGLRQQPAYRRELKSPHMAKNFTSGLRHRPDVWPYRYPLFTDGLLSTPQLRELDLRFASSTGYHDYHCVADMIRTITIFLRELGDVPKDKFKVAFYYGRGYRSTSAEMDYLQLKPREVIEARNPSVHLCFEPVVPQLVFVQALLDQGWSYEEINYRIYGDVLREEGKEHLFGMDRAVLPRNLDGWVCPWTGLDVKVRALEIWGVYRWWLKDDREVPRW
jgi:hypothetical protein